MWRIYIAHKEYSCVCVCVSVMIINVGNGYADVVVFVDENLPLWWKRLLLYF